LAYGQGRAEGDVYWFAIRAYDDSRFGGDFFACSFGSVRLIRANSLSAKAGVARISLIRVLQNIMLPSPIIAIFFDMVFSPVKVFLIIKWYMVGYAASRLLANPT